MVYLKTLLASRTILRPTAWWVRNARANVAAFEVLRRHPSGGVEENLDQGSASTGDFPETGQQSQLVVTRLWRNKNRGWLTWLVNVWCNRSNISPPPYTIDSHVGQGEGGAVCLLQLIGNGRRTKFFFNTRDIKSTYTNKLENNSRHICCNSDRAKFG